MRRLYDKNEVTFAVLWIVFYCVLMANMQGTYGYEGFPTFAALAVIAAAIFFFLKHEHLEARYGLDHWPKDTKRYLYLIPMWIAATGNLWSGFGMEYQGIQQLLATLSMALVGFIEEMLFRGFLFRGMLKDGKTLNAIIISRSPSGSDTSSTSLPDTQALRHSFRSSLRSPGDLSSQWSITDAEASFPASSLTA